MEPKRTPIWPSYFFPYSEAPQTLSYIDWPEPLGGQFSLKIWTVRICETSEVQHTYTRCNHPQTVSTLTFSLLEFERFILFLKETSELGIISALRDY